jgi:transposase
VGFATILLGTLSGEKMGLSPQLITAEVYEKAKKELANVGQKHRKGIRLRAIVSGYEHGMNCVAKIFGINSNTLRAWVKSFIKEGVEGLEYKPGRGRKSHINEDCIEKVKQWVKKDSGITIAKIVIRLKDECGVNTSKSAVHRLLGQIELSYITPRPMHHKQEKSKQIEFKKKSR